MLSKPGFQLIRCKTSQLSNITATVGRRQNCIPYALSAWFSYSLRLPYCFMNNKYDRLPGVTKSDLMMPSWVGTPVASSVLSETVSPSRAVFVNLLFGQCCINNGSVRKWGRWNLHSCLRNLKSCVGKYMETGRCFNLLDLKRRPMVKSETGSVLGSISDLCDNYYNTHSVMNLVPFPNPSSGYLGCQDGIIDSQSRPLLPVLRNTQ